MPLVFTRDQIKGYLEELGYAELSDENLDHFIHDLKKLIRHESKLRHQQALEFQSQSENTQVEISSSPESKGHSKKTTGGAPRSTGHSKQTTTEQVESQDHSREITTDGSAAKGRSKKTTVGGSGSRGHSKQTTTEQVESQDHSREITTDSSAAKGSSKKTTVGGSGSRGHSKQTTTEQVESQDHSREITGSSEAKGHSRETAAAGRPEKVQKQSEAKNVTAESQGGSARKKWSDRTADTNNGDNEPSSASPDSSSSTSSISSGTTVSSSSDSDLWRYTGKWDPVSRYHYYKRLWDRQKAPGEDRHMQLRWNVRAGTMGRVPCDPFGVQIKYLRPNQLRLGPEKSGKQLCCIRSCM